MTFAASASRYRDTLIAARRKIAPAFEWYPYDSLANAERMDRLLAGHPEVLDTPEASRVLDIGCADGDTSFFLESLGFPVTAIDHASTNHNGMRGIRALRDHLGSRIQILETDIDSQFTFPPERFRLALFLGLLYHLKNPFHALERLARNCDYCLLSTRIARKLPDGCPMSPEHPLAYLLAADELNRDNSNYWIFNEAGLRRLLVRTHWEVFEYFTIGDTTASDPVSQERDERAFCLLRSHYGLANVELLHGWHQTEAEGWRWVGREFAIRSDCAASTLRLRGFLPAEVLATLGPIRLSIAVDGNPLLPELISAAGEFAIVRRLPDTTANCRIDFAADKAMPPSATDPRELALIVSAIDLE